MKRLATAVLALALLPAAAAQAQVEAIEPTFQLDRKRDVRGPLDIVRVAMSKRPNGSLRGELTMRRAWEDADVGDGSLCLRFHVKTDPASQAPEYLACATLAADGTLAGRVLRNPAELRFSGESVWRGTRCPAVTACRDLAPDAPGARKFRLRRESASG